MESGHTIYDQISACLQLHQRERYQCTLLRNQIHQPFFENIHHVLSIFFPPFTMCPVPSHIDITAGGLSQHTTNKLTSSNFSAVLVRTVFLFDSKTDWKLTSSSSPKVKYINGMQTICVYIYIATNFFLCETLKLLPPYFALSNSYLK